VHVLVFINYVLAYSQVLSQPTPDIISYLFGD